ncbi:MAG: putative rRNA methylase [Pseudonocardiales bacterium]|nr:putative rRNA methylase [Pseudonocardiales bacterium]
MNDVRRRLDSELVRLGLASTRTRAVELIARGRVTVDGAIATKPSLDVTGRDLVLESQDGDVELASRGGHKLLGALDEFDELVVLGRRCLDAGASTGGFTDALLHRGAREVVAVDVGHGQLISRLREHLQVQVYEGCNVRSLTPLDIGGDVELTVADLSFISLPLVLPALAACTRADGDLLLLVKPQFEVGRRKLGRGGVVRNIQDRRDAVTTVARAAAELGWGSRAVTRSALPGPAGNVEYFLWLRRDAPVLDPAAVTAIIGDAP